MTNFRNWIPELHGESRTSILALEYWCYDEDEMWSEDDATLIERAKREVRESGLVRSAPVVDGHVFRIREAVHVTRKVA